MPPSVCPDFIERLVARGRVTSPECLPWTVVIQVLRGGDLFGRTAIAALSRPHDLPSADLSTVLRRSPADLPPRTPRLARHESTLADRPPSSATHRRKPTCPRTTRPTHRHRAAAPSPSRPNPESRHRPTNWCHPSNQTDATNQTGATRGIELREESKLGPPGGWISETSESACESVPPVSQTRAESQTGATRQLTTGERQAGATRASESVPPVSQAQAENGKGATPLFTGGNAALLWGSFLVARRPRRALVRPRCSLIRQRNTLLGLFF